MQNNIYEKVGNATKWSAITELLSKIVTPISNMALARILEPEAFGIVSTITMITSFADIFTDAGFQKYIIQHQFKDDEERNNSINVAFWTNLAISVLIWTCIIIFVHPIVYFVGAKGSERAIVIASAVLVLTAFSSIQMAIYKSVFDFRTLFIVKCVLVAVPFIITIPVALITRSYWSLIIGNLCLNGINALILTVKSSWKPRLYFNSKLFKEMFSFSVWTLTDNILNWFTTWGDTFIVGVALSAYYVGLYKTSMNTVNSIMNIITGATTSVLLTALSKLQRNKSEFDRMLFTFQHSTVIFLFPMGVGIYLYRDLITSILLGSQWGEVANFIGLWGMMSAIAIPFNTYGSCVCIAKGKPRLSAIAQVAQILALFPVVYISSGFGFKALYTARTLIRFEGILVFVLIMKISLGISILEMLKGLLVPAFCSGIMALIALILQSISRSVIWSFVSIGICALVYFMVMLLFPRERKELLDFYTKIVQKITK